MKCENCKQHEATVHVTTIHNGDKREHHLCETCAGKNEYGSMMWQQFNLWDNEFFKSLMAPGGYSPDSRLVCDSCGMRYRDFARGGKLGCPMCYQSFRAKLDPVITRWQGAGQHVGNTPHTDGQSAQTASRLQQLRRELMQAVAAEEYEKAAQLRDEIRRMEHGENSEEAKDHGH